VRIEIFGINYSPEETGIGPFTTGLAERLSGDGHEVVVLTGVPHYPSWRRGPSPGPSITGPEVIRCQHYVPKNHNILGRAIYEASWTTAVSFRHAALRRRKPDVVLGVVPAFGSLPLAVLAGRRPGAAVGILFQDLIGPAIAQSGNSSLASAAGDVISRLELALARAADGVAVVADTFIPYLVRGGVSGQRITLIPNWGRVDVTSGPRSETRASLGWNGQFVCLHAGNMGQKQGLDNVLAAAARLKGENIRFVLVGDGNDSARLHAIAIAQGLMNVTFLPVQELPLHGQMLRAADVLILNQRKTVTDMAFPSKLASYFQAGRPVVAAVDEASGAAMEAKSAGAALVVPPENPEALAQAVLNLMHDNALCDRLGASGLQHAQTTVGKESSLAAASSWVTALARTNTTHQPLK
jgi:colanic acid biosynthesis glycosyl transferase WcaI